MTVQDDSAAGQDIRSSAASAVTDGLTLELQALLRRRWNEPDLGVVAVEAFGDGHSGFTYLIELRSARASGQFVMRLSPPGARIAGNADVGRQGRIMEALHAAGLPTPEVLLADSDGALGGRAVVIMQQIEGAGWQAAAASHGDSWVVDAALHMLHRIRDLPVEAIGLTGEAPQSANDSLLRWSKLLEHVPDELAPNSRPLLAALASSPPDPVTACLVHGDYHYGNLLFGPSGVTGLLDWEVAEIGDPRWDFGSLAVAAIRRKYRPEPNPTGNLEVSVGELTHRYGDQPDLSWFVAANCLKYVAILGYNLGLHLRGKRRDPVYEQLRGTTVGLARDGLEALAGRSI
jgi:aminoglycoside phosphotransferase (APT) family kinase protein